MSVDIKLKTPVGDVVVEYDGWFWHKDRLAKDTEKTELLLSYGYKVIRVREISGTNCLPLLHTLSPNLLQIHHLYGEGTDKAIPKILT